MYRPLHPTIARLTFGLYNSDGPDFCMRGNWKPLYLCIYDNCRWNTVVALYFMLWSRASLYSKLRMTLQVHWISVPWRIMISRYTSVGYRPLNQLLPPGHREGHFNVTVAKPRTYGEHTAIYPGSSLLHVSRDISATCRRNCRHT